MRKSAMRAAILSVGTIFLLTGLLLLIAPLAWNSNIGHEAAYLLRDTLRKLIGEGIALDDDSTIALGLLLIFQGIRLLEAQGQTAGSLLYSLWLSVPALLAIALLDSKPGTLPLLISSLLPGDPPAPLFLSVILTILFRMLISMTRNVQSGSMDGREERMALPYPRIKDAERPAPIELEIIDDIQDMEGSTSSEVQVKEDLAAPPAPSSSIEPGTEVLIGKLLKDAAAPATYQVLVRKRKKLLTLSPEELSKATDSMRGFRVYRDGNGAIGNIEDEMAGMIVYLFSPLTLIVMNRKDTIRRIAINDLCIPAFSQEQAMEIAKTAVEGYSKGGYSYSALEGKLQIAGKRLNVERQDFLVPWYRKELSYDDMEIADRLFAWDFRLKYGLERGLMPYLPGLGEDKA